MGKNESNSIWKPLALDLLAQLKVILISSKYLTAVFHNILNPNLIFKFFKHFHISKFYLFLIFSLQNSSATIEQYTLITYVDIVEDQLNTTSNDEMSEKVEELADRPIL